MELLDLCDDVLLHILSFLDPIDEFALSKTCTRFKEMCQSGWSSLTLNLGQETESNVRKLKLTEYETEVLEISGDRMQNMHISVDFSEANKFDQQSLDLLETESEKWNLNKFRFDALNIDDRYTRFFSRMLRPVLSSALCYLDSKNTRNANLETLSLSVQDWSYYSSVLRNRLADKLHSSNFHENLKNLTLDYFFFCRSPQFSMDNFNERFCSEYSRVIARFKHLQKLEINSGYLSNSLLGILSQPDRVNLQSVTLVLDRFFGKEITSWPQLVNSSPSLEVTVESSYDDSGEHVRILLPACVPIVSWKIYSFPRVKPYNPNKMRDMFNLLCLYKHTLQTVAVQNGSKVLCHSALMKMVTQCYKLQTLYFQGRISSNALLKMASLQRLWLKLSVLERDISFPRSWKQGNKENIARLCEEVSKKLSSKWKPELETTFKAIFNCPVLY